MKLFDQVNEIIKLDSGEDWQGEEFNKCLRGIQNTLGQEDGGIAGIFFDDERLDMWNSGEIDKRFKVISEYIALEVRMCY